MPLEGSDNHQDNRLLTSSKRLLAGQRNLVYSNATSIDVQNNVLFPKLLGGPSQNRHLYLDPDQDITEENDDSSSVQNLGHMFNRNRHLELDLSDQNLFQTNFDSDIDEESFDNSHKVSLDSSILDKVPANLDEIDLGTDRRFKYLATYETLAKESKEKKKAAKIMETLKNQHEVPLETWADEDSAKSPASSIFHLSTMDDYSKYVRMTNINDQIHQRVTPKDEDANVLGIVDARDLADKFYHNHEDERESKLLKPKPTLSSRLKNWKKPPVTETHYSLNESESPYSSSLKYDDEDHKPRYLQRKLKVRHLQMISFGGTLGVGLFLNSGKAFTIAGGFGTLLAFIICGIVVLTTIVSFCEMVTFVSIVDGVSGLSSRFVDDAFGFSVGWLYFLSFAFGIAGEIVASVILLTYFPQLEVLSNKGSAVGFVSLFLFLIVFVNLVDVRVFGEIEYFSSLIKLVSILVMIVVMIVINRGGTGSNGVLGFKYWDYSRSQFDHNVIFGLFRPSFNLNDTGMSSPSEGVGSDEGRFLSLLTAIMVVSYAYSGTEIVCIAACEAKNPRKALPSATRRVFWRILLFYCLSSFLVSLNIYAGDPRLLRYWSSSTGVSSSEFSSNYAINYVGGANCYSKLAIYAGMGSGSQSPWVVALQSAGLCRFSSVLNGFLIFFAVSCGNAQLYVASRTMYSLALQKKAPKCMTYCNKAGIPYNAVLFAASFGLLSYIVVSEKATSVFSNLTNIIASSGIIVWFAMCLSFLRFYYGLKIRPDIISRDDKAYPYKSPFQPYLAIIGLVGSTVIILGMGFTIFLNGQWDTLSFFTSYGTLIVFAILYIAYRMIRGTSIPSLETLDFDTGRREIDRYIWDGGKEYNSRSFKDVTQKMISSLA